MKNSCLMTLPLDAAVRKSVKFLLIWGEKLRALHLVLLEGQQEKMLFFPFETLVLVKSVNGAKIYL